MMLLLRGDREPPREADITSDPYLTKKTPTMPVSRELLAQFPGWLTGSSIKQVPLQASPLASGLGF